MEAVRKETRRARKEYQARRRRQDLALATKLSRELRRKKRTLSSAIRRAKRRKWLELIQELENDPWEQGYQILVKLSGPKDKIAMEEKREKRTLRDSSSR